MKNKRKTQFFQPKNIQLKMGLNWMRCDDDDDDYDDERMRIKNGKFCVGEKVDFFRWKCYTLYL